MNKFKIKINEDPYNDIGFLLWQIVKKWQKGRNKVLDEFGITLSQLEILSAIYFLQDSEQEVTQIAISNATNVDPMTTSTIIRNLEKKGIVERRSSQLDTRAFVVQSTEKGEEIRHEAFKKLKKLNDEELKGVNLEDLKKQLNIFLNALNVADDGSQTK